MGLKILGISLDVVLRLANRIGDPAGFYVEFRQRGGQKFGGRIGFDGLAVFFRGFRGQIAAAVSRDHLFVHVRQRVVIIGSRLIDFVLGGGLRGLRWLVWATATEATAIIIKESRRSLFILNLIAHAARFRNLNLFGCKVVEGEVLLFYREGWVGREKTKVTRRSGTRGTNMWEQPMAAV